MNGIVKKPPWVVNPIVEAFLEVWIKIRLYPPCRAFPWWTDRTPPTRLPLPGTIR